jgi:hypothetical protein
MYLRVISDRNLLILGRVWFTTGLCLVALALGFGGQTGVFLMRSVTATGTIVRRSPSIKNTNRLLDAPTFSFTAEDGESYTVTSGVSTIPPEFAIGQKVKAFYEKYHPKSAKLDSFWQLWFLSFLFGILGIFFTGAGYVILQYQRRRAQQHLMNPLSGGAIPGNNL